MALPYVDEFGRDTRITVDGGEVPVTDRFAQQQRTEALNVEREQLIELRAISEGLHPPAVQQVAGTVEVAGVARDTTLNLVAGLIADLATAVNALSERPHEVNVTAPPIPPELVALASASLLPSPPSEVKLDEASLDALTKLSKPVVVGGSQVREVRVQSSNATVIDPATEETLAQVRDSLDTVEAKLAALDATLNKTFATAYKTAFRELMTATTNQALLSETANIVYVKVLHYDGANATFSGIDGAADVGGNFLRIGTNTSPKVPLWTLTKPDSDVLFEGYITGNVYLTSTAQAGKNLALIVGTA